jgi:hypothetical protein
MASRVRLGDSGASYDGFRFKRRHVDVDEIKAFGLRTSRRCDFDCVD